VEKGSSSGGRRFAKKSFGQNFLVDGNFVSKIVDALDIVSEDRVIEIGPGRGALTERLLENAGSVVAIELDSDLIPLLQSKFGKDHKFELIENDVLRVDFTSINLGAGMIKIVANLPYNISTATLQHLIQYRERISKMVLMFQREVVERITARPGSADRGYLTVITEAFLKIEKLFEVPPAAFRPVPKVWSSVVRLTPVEGPDELKGRESEFAKLVSIGFSQKRKTILNNLKAANKEFGGKTPVELLSASGIDPKRRAETLTIDEWKRLFTYYCN
jgi:16S rRNA (adenine1518-N6/adenine1519-N6)-dimethyltransferase